MLKNNLNALIMEAMKNHDNARVESLRAIKAAFMNWQTSKEHAGQEMTETDEIQVLKKMVKQRKESIEQYAAANRNDLVEAETAQVTVIKEFLPLEASESDIEQAFYSLNSEIEPIKKNMGLFIKAIKEHYPTADGKLVAQIVSQHLN
jgi:uncharacterized protein YqeY